MKVRDRHAPSSQNGTVAGWRWMIYILFLQLDLELFAQKRQTRLALPAPTQHIT